MFLLPLFLVGRGMLSLGEHFLWGDPIPVRLCPTMPLAVRPFFFIAHWNPTDKDHTAALLNLRGVPTLVELLHKSGADCLVARRLLRCFELLAAHRKFPPTEVMNWCL